MPYDRASDTSVASPLRVGGPLARTDRHQGRRGRFHRVSVKSTRCPQPEMPSIDERSRPQVRRHLSAIPRLCRRDPPLDAFSPAGRSPQVLPRFESFRRARPPATQSPLLLVRGAERLRFSGPRRRPPTSAMHLRRAGTPCVRFVLARESDGAEARSAQSPRMGPKPRSPTGMTAPPEGGSFRVAVS